MVCLIKNDRIPLTRDRIKVSKHLNLFIVGQNIFIEREEQFWLIVVTLETASDSDFFSVFEQSVSERLLFVVEVGVDSLAAEV